MYKIQKRPVLRVFLYVHNSFLIFLCVQKIGFLAIFDFCVYIIGHFYFEILRSFDGNCVEFWRCFGKFSDGVSRVCRDELDAKTIFVRTKNRVFGAFLTLFKGFVAKSPLFFTKVA